MADVARKTKSASSSSRDKIKYRISVSNLERK